MIWNIALHIIKKKILLLIRVKGVGAHSPVGFCNKESEETHFSLQIKRITDKDRTDLKETVLFLL